MTSVCKSTHARKSSGVLSVGLIAIMLSIGPAAVAQAQQPLRIGASVSQTGAYAAIGQNLLRGYQLCVKRENEKGGLLGRRIEFAAEDDQSQAATAIRIYEKLITQDKVDAVFSPYSSPLTDAVADIVEKHKFPMVACCAATSAIYRKGRKFIFMVPTPSEKYLEGVVDIAARRGLKTIALIYEDSLHPKAITEGAVEFAKKKGLQVAHRMATYQWQDGKKVIVWPDDLAPGKARFPTPPWSQRP